MVNEKQVLLKQLPAVDTVLREAAVLRLQERYGQATVTRALRALLDTWRQQILQGIWSANSLQEALATLPQALAMQVQAEEQPNLHPVINATGVIIHTNLGRSLLAAAAKNALS